MNYKIVVMFGLTILFSCLYIIPSYAYTEKPLLEYNNIFIIYDSTYNNYRLCYTDQTPTSQLESPNYWWVVYLNGGNLSASTLDGVMGFLTQNPSVLDNDSRGINTRSYLNIIKGSITGDIPDFTIFPEPPAETTWWDKVKQAFMYFVGSEALSDVLSGNWLAYIEDVLFGELWTVKVGEGEDDMIIPDTVSATPSPSPTPLPTPIPYSTVIDPGTGEVHYHYTIDVSGTPVPTSSIYPPVTYAPPGPGSGSTIDEPVAVEDYYEPEDSLSVPKLRIFKFLLRMTGNDVDVGMDSLDNNMAVMDATLDDNAEAISGVGDLFQLIPVKWFLLIGNLACFPVIAAMIKSLLG